MKKVFFLLTILIVAITFGGCGGGGTGSTQPVVKKVGFVVSVSPYTETTTEFSPAIVKMATHIDPIVVDSNNITVPVVSWEVTCPDGHKFTRKTGELVPFMSAEYVGKYTFIANVYSGGDPMNGGGIHKISGTLTIESP